jgi:ATP-dependent DNA ligase
MTTRPMLAETMDIDDFPKYVKDDDWATQYKADGHRLLVHIENGQVTALGRNGQAKVSGLSHTLLAQFEAFKDGTWTFDGELIGSQLVLFDVACAGSHAQPDTPFKERYRVLEVLYRQVWQPDPQVIGLLPVAWTADDKLAMARAAEQEKREGIMFRHIHGHYKNGGRSSHLLKCKFTKEADCIVTDLNVDGHDNVELTLLDPEGIYTSDGFLNVGRASAIGKRPKPEKMDVWEVRFLYVVDPAAPRLYQPRLIQKRVDKELHECTVDQIAHAFTDKDLADKVRTEE